MPFFLDQVPLSKTSFIGPLVFGFRSSYQMTTSSYVCATSCSNVLCLTVSEVFCIVRELLKEEKRDDAYSFG